jgi:hypothetical protein
MELAVLALLGWGGLLAIGLSMAFSKEYIPPERRCTCRLHFHNRPQIGNVITSQVRYVALEPHGDVAAGSVVVRTCRIHLN